MVVREPAMVGAGTASTIQFLDFCKAMSFNGSPSFEGWVEIQGRGGMVLVVLKVVRDDIE